MERRKSQNDRVVDYMNRYGSITPLEAMRDLGIYRLASRISDLKEKGYAVKSRWVPVATRDGGKTRIKAYSLK